MGRSRLALLSLCLVLYTLARGASVDWYPYPFVDAGELGYGGVLGRASVLLVGFALAALALLLLGNRLAGRRAAAAA